MKKFVNWLIAKNAIRAEDAELYLYGIQSLGLLLLPFAVALIFGFVFGVVKESILVVFPFIILRKYSGGYHAKHLWQCCILSTVIIGFSIWVVTVIQLTMVFHLCVWISVASLIICSPVDSEKRRLSPGEKRKYKLIVLRVLIICIIVYMAIWTTGVDIACKCLGIGIILTESMQVQCVLYRFRK